MNARIQRLVAESVATEPRLSAERAEILTRVYREFQGRVSTPVLRATAFRALCEEQTLHIGADELIVGERGPRPRTVPTYPELTCHSLDDLRVLDGRDRTAYRTGPDVLEAYEREVIPFWRGRSMRDRIFARVPGPWKAAYEAGVFTEFMEQRAPGHTALDGTIYRKGMDDFRAEIAARRARLDPLRDPDATRKDEQLEAMDIACAAIVGFAQRHADLAETLAEDAEPSRREELEGIARVCRRVPARAPRTFHEAIQMYWFVHLGTVMELNGWDAMNPGHIDQHLAPFYERGLADGTLDREGARELLSCLWVKFNNQPAPPKVGVTVRRGYGYPSAFNADVVVAEQVAAGKTVRDAREGGTSGCIETGAFGKEAYFLTGYLNLPKILEITLHDGIDPGTGARVGPATGAIGDLATFDALYGAFEVQLKHFVDVKVEVNQAIESLFARDCPAPFLSVLIADCIQGARDYHEGGARYNTTYIQCCGIGTLTDGLSAIRTHVFEDRTVDLGT
ncbi:MAG: pyruvate formate lyase family protein, partial [Gemmatimonadota bacterium]